MKLKLRKSKIPHKRRNKLIKQMSQRMMTSMTKRKTRRKKRRRRKRMTKITTAKTAITTKKRKRRKSLVTTMMVTMTAKYGQNVNEGKQVMNQMSSKKLRRLKTTMLKRSKRKSQRRTQKKICLSVNLSTHMGKLSKKVSKNFRSHSPWINSRLSQRATVRINRSPLSLKVNRLHSLHPKISKVVSKCHKLPKYPNFKLNKK